MSYLFSLPLECVWKLGCNIVEVGLNLKGRGQQRPCVCGDGAVLLPSTVKKGSSDQNEDHHPNLGSS